MLVLGPNAAILLLTSGVALLVIEFNRPGTVLAGAVGLVAVLIALAAIWRLSPRSWIILLLVGCAVLPIVNLRRRAGVLAATVATVALSAAFLRLPVGSGCLPVSYAVALPCAIFLGAGTTLLTTIARRARQNKGLDLKRARTSRPESLPLDS